MTGTHQSALQLDEVIDTLLREASGPTQAGDTGLTATARLLRDALPRLHPRFGFEELLAARLAAAGRPVGSVGISTPTPLRPGAQSVVVDTSSVVEAVERRRRNLLAGGAIASGVSLALPIAGAALVVWRRTRSPGGFS